MAGVIHGHRLAGSLGANPLNCEFDLDLAGPLKLQRAFDVLSLLKWLLEPYQHHVKGVRGQHN